MSGKLRCYSFHSVKGGVGKSTLSVMAALALSRSVTRVYLVDADLTGTSLADVLPLRAPRWQGKGPEDELDLLIPPQDFYPVDRTLELIDVCRHEHMKDPRRPIGAPFLNDFLLYATPEWDGVSDVLPAAVCWSLEGGPENLRVIPSTALPEDIEQILPAIFDEPKVAFLEGRIERLLDALLEDEGEVAVVFDTPPSIPGLSRSVLNLALRLSGGPAEKQPLARDGRMPARLRQTQVSWHAFLVSTLDEQDLRAAGRWLDLRQEAGAKNALRPLINRMLPSDESQLENLLDERLAETEIPGNPWRPTGNAAPATPPISKRRPVFEDVVAKIAEDDTLRIFRASGDASAWMVDAERAMAFLVGLS